MAKPNLKNGGMICLFLEDLAIKEQTHKICLVHGLYDSAMFAIPHNFEPILLKLILSRKKVHVVSIHLNMFIFVFFSCRSLSLWQNLIICSTCKVLSRL